MRDETAPGALTAREQEVLDCFVETAKTDKEMAKQLGISPKTVQTHWARILEKLGLHDRTLLLHAKAQGKTISVVDPRLQTVLVAECPGPGTPAGRALPLFPYPAGSSGARLCEVLDLSRDEYFRRFRRVNLFPTHQAEWDPVLARQAAENLRSLLEGRRAVLVGNRVRDAFEVSDAQPHCNWFHLPGLHTVGGFTALLIHHPSGRNPWYNDHSNREQVRRALCPTQT